MHYIVEGALGANLATNDTLTLAYPSRTDSGEFRLAANHKATIGYNQLSYPKDFTLSFGTSSITLTYIGTGTLPAGLPYRIQLEAPGTGAYRDQSTGSLIDHAYKMTGLLVNLGAPDIADADGYCASQNLTSAGVFSSSGTAAAAIAAAALAGRPDKPRNVVAAWTGTAVITITGKDVYGNTMVESSGSGTSLTGKKAFAQVTGIAVSANVTALTVGTGDVLGLPVAVPSAAMVKAIYKNGIKVGSGAEVVRLDWNADQVSVLAGTVAGIELISPIAGTISSATTVVRAAVNTGGDVTLAAGTEGTTAVDGLTMTVANSAAKGTTVTDAPTAGHASTLVSKNNRIVVLFGDAFNTAAALDGYVEITPTIDAVTYGTFVSALISSKSTATTGDVRGTFTPREACDGAADYQIELLLTDPGNVGQSQYAG